MRILHTADWHVGRRLGRHDRTAEMRAALDEVAAIADRERVDLVIVSGDVFDRAAPPVEALSLGLGALLRLADDRPLFVVAGNHDAPELFDALSPLLRRPYYHVMCPPKPTESKLSRNRIARHLRQSKAVVAHDSPRSWLRYMSVPLR